MSPFIRIALRYVAAALVTRGVLSPEAGALLSHDPDVAVGVEIILGLLLAALAEGGYLLARRFGWRT